MEAEGPVAFSSVVNPVSVHHQKSNQIIQFETILTNYGGGYNNETGIFVVPVPGKCFFFIFKGIPSKQTLPAAKSYVEILPLR